MSNSVSNQGTLVIGLAGGTGSGKTTVSQAVVRAAGAQQVLILPQDAFYRAQHELPFAVREKTNYDEPSAFDTPLLVEQLDALLRGEMVEQPVYDFAAHTRAETTVRVQPRPVIVVEGILVLHDAPLRERFTLSVFVDAPPDERFIRRLERDVRERGRSAQSVIEQYRRSVKPMHDLFVEPTKAHADLIIPEGAHNRVALEVLSAFVSSFIQKDVVQGDFIERGNHSAQPEDDARAGSVQDLNDNNDDGDKQSDKQGVKDAGAA